MIRKGISIIMVSLLLVSQAGLPLHLHYCKGMLESVNVLFKSGCEEHEVATNLPACCAKFVDTHCAKGNSDCCDDEVQILTQDITSVPPHSDQWPISLFELPAITFPTFLEVDNQGPAIVYCSQLDLGPPVYILHQSLIFYA